MPHQLGDTSLTFRKMNVVRAAVFVGIAIASVIASQSQAAADKKVVCYYGSWAVYRHGNGLFDVEHIDPFVCTHIVYGFVGLSDTTHQIEVLDPYNDLEENWGRGAMKRFTGFKQQNPNLKALVAIGGWNQESERYSKMAMDPAKRRIFVQSVVPFLESQNFDGLDFDWEYPANREGASPVDKENFVLLLNELRAELEPRGYLLTGAVSAGQKTIETAYDIPAVARALDFISVMAYDLHGAWENFTGHHSPLYGNEDIDYGDNIMLNTDHAIRYWIEHGAPAEKLVLGIGTYGRGFSLDDPSQNDLYAPAQNPISAGPYTGTDGFWGYNEICEKMEAQQGQWTIVNDPVYQVPYAYNGRQWIGYDSVESVANKARYVKEKGLGGGMIWSIETDDFHGLYHSEPFPLVKTLYRELNGEYPAKPSTTTEDPRNTKPTTAPTTAAPPPPSDVCKEEGVNPDPTKPCSTVFYMCEVRDGQWFPIVNQCPTGLIFNPEIDACDFPANVSGCS
jgi:chitinase